MDAINYLSNRQINPECILSTNQEMADCDGEYFSDMLKTLDHLLEKQVKTWWDVFTFEQCPLRMV